MKKFLRRFWYSYGGRGCVCMIAAGVISFVFSPSRPWMNFHGAVAVSCLAELIRCAMYVVWGYYILLSARKPWASLDDDSDMSGTFPYGLIRTEKDLDLVS